MFGRAAPRTPWRRLASLLLLLLLPGFVSAAPRFNNTAWPTQEGRSFVLSWTNNDGPVSIILMARRGTSQSPVATIANEITGSFYTWVPSGIGSGTYSLLLRDSTGETGSSPDFSYLSASATRSSLPTLTSPSFEETGSPGGDDGGLSTAEKAGVGVGAVVGGVALIALFGVFMYRRGRAAAGQGPAGAGTGDASEPGGGAAFKSELDGGSKGLGQQPATELGTDPHPELAGQPLGEMDSVTPAPVEKSGAHDHGRVEPAELSAHAYQGR